MALQDDVQELIDFGIFNEDSVERLASVIRTVRSLSPGGAAPPRGRMGRPRGRPAGGGGGGGGKRKRAPRGSFNVTKEELSKMRETMTAKQIAAKYGVSAGTVAQKAMKMGLATPRGKKGKK